jgi:hypothetical protein
MENLGKMLFVTKKVCFILECNVWSKRIEPAMSPKIINFFLQGVRLCSAI